MSTERITVTLHTKARPIRNPEDDTHGQTPEVTVTVTYDEGDWYTAWLAVNQATGDVYRKNAKGDTE